MNELSRRLGAALVIILYIVLALLLALAVATPWLLGGPLRLYFGSSLLSYVFVYVGILSIGLLLFSMLQIMRSVQKGNPFVMANVRSLRRIAAACLVCAADLIAFRFVMQPYSIVLLLTVGILLFGMLCAIVLACVFNQAVLYKQENDLTI